MDEISAKVAEWVERLREAGVGEDLWFDVIDEISRLGHDAVPAILDHLGDEDRAVYVGLQKAIGRMEPLPVFYLCDHLRYGTELSRSRIPLLFSADRDPVAFAEAVPTLADALTDSDPDVRRWSAMALCLGGVHSEAAILALISALKDKDWSVREWSAHALGGMEVKEAEGPLTELLVDEVPPVRDAASEAIDAIRRRWSSSD